MHCAPTGWVPRLNAPMLCSQASVHPCSVHTGSAPKPLYTQAQHLCTQASLHPGPTPLHPGLCAPRPKVSAARSFCTQAQALCTQASLHPGLSAPRPLCPSPDCTQTLCPGSRHQAVHLDCAPPESLQPRIWTPMLCAAKDWEARLNAPRLCSQGSLQPCSLHRGSAPKPLQTQAQDLCTQGSLHPGPRSLHPGLSAPRPKASATKALCTQAQGLCTQGSLHPGPICTQTPVPLPRLHPESLPRL